MSLLTGRTYGENEPVKQAVKPTTKAAELSWLVPGAVDHHTRNKALETAVGLRKWGVEESATNGRKSKNVPLTPKSAAHLLANTAPKAGRTDWAKRLAQLNARRHESQPTALDR